MHVDNTSCSSSTYFKLFSNIVTLYIDHSMAYILTTWLIILRSCSNCAWESYCRLLKTGLLLWNSAVSACWYYWFMAVWSLQKVAGGTMEVALENHWLMRLEIATMWRGFPHGQSSIVQHAVHREWSYDWNSETGLKKREESNNSVSNGLETC